MQEIQDAVSRRTIVAGGIALILTLLAATVAVLAVLRDNALERAQGHLANLATVLGEQTRQSVQAIELLVKSTADELIARDVYDPSLSSRQILEHIRARQSIMPDVRVLLFTDPSGRAVTSPRRT